MAKLNFLTCQLNGLVLSQQGILARIRVQGQEGRAVRSAEEALRRTVKTRCAYIMASSDLFLFWPRHAVCSLSSGRDVRHARNLLRFSGGGHKKSGPSGISLVLTLIVTPLDLFAFVCSFGVIISIVFRFIQLFVFLTCFEY